MSSIPAPDPTQFVFGFGRRICPGRLLAENALYLNIVQSLTVFYISKAVDQDGTEVEPVVKMEPGVVSHPAPFTTCIKVRSKHHEELLRRVEQKWPWRESNAKDLESINV